MWTKREDRSSLLWPHSQLVWSCARMMSSCVTCSIDSGEPAPTRTTRPEAMASCVEGELKARVESAAAASSLTSGAPEESRVTNGEMAPALTMTTGEPGLCCASCCSTRAARCCVPVLSLPSRATQCLEICAWLSGCAIASLARASAACVWAMGVPSSSSSTRGWMPLQRAMEVWLALSSARCHRQHAENSRACTVPEESSATSGMIPPASAINTRQSAAPSSSSSFLPPPSPSPPPGCGSYVTDRVSLTLRPAALSAARAFSRAATAPRARSDSPAAAISCAFSDPVLSSCTSSGMALAATMASCESLVLARCHRARDVWSWASIVPVRCRLSSGATPLASMIASCMSRLSYHCGSLNHVPGAALVPGMKK